MALRLNLYPAGPSKSFASPKVLKQHAARQHEKWTKFADGLGGFFHQTVSQITNDWNHLENLFGIEPPADDLEQQLQTNLKHHPRCFEFDAPFGRYIRSLVNDGEAEELAGAIWAGAKLAPQVQLNRISPDHMLGMAHALQIIRAPEYLAKSSLKKTADAAISELEERLADTFDEHRAKIDGQSARFDQLNKGVEDLNTDWGQKRTDLEKLTNKGIMDAKAEWRELRHQFEEELKLTTAVKLWEQRAEDHGTSYGNYRTTALFVGGIGTLVLAIWLFFGFWLIGDTGGVATRIARYAAISFVLSTGVIWALRITVRSMIAESHLQIDASARAAMAHTYLALMKDDSATKDDRAIVLAALFNPVTDGLIKDDAMPSMSPTAAVASAITNRGN